MRQRATIQCQPQISVCLCPEPQPRSCPVRLVLPDPLRLSLPTPGRRVLEFVVDPRAKVDLAATARVSEGDATVLVRSPRSPHSPGDRPRRLALALRRRGVLGGDRHPVLYKFVLRHLEVSAAGDFETVVYIADCVSAALLEDPPLASPCLVQTIDYSDVVACEERVRERGVERVGVERVGVERVSVERVGTLLTFLKGALEVAAVLNGHGNALVLRERGEN